MTISLENLKGHLNVMTTDDDDLLQDKIDAASEWIAQYTGVPIDAPDTPAPFDEATRQLAAHLFENREATLVGVTAQALPFGFLDLLNPYREWAF
jgi:uncharacterized phage protein (predicted DNA packaging)